MANSIITPAGIARDAEGRPSDMPRDLVHGVNHEMFKLLTLLHAAASQATGVCTESGSDPEGFTDASSRTTVLLGMGIDRANDILKRIAPYF